MFQEDDFSHVHKKEQIGAAYIRVSTEEQIEYSPDSQLKKIREYALQHGIELKQEYIFLDEGISGRSAVKRPGFMKMIAIAKSRPRPFDVILLWKYSRFARNRQDSILYKSMLRKECGIEVVSITEQLSKDPTAILIEALLEAMDEYYSINLAQEVRRGMNEKFSRGGVVSIPPFGYKMGKEHFEEDEEKAPFLIEMFEKYRQGCSCREIAADLNRRGILSGRGNPFENRTVEYILSNPVYVGMFRRNTKGGDKKDRFLRGEGVEVIRGSHCPLVSDELFQDVQRRLLERRSNTVSKKERKSEDFMLKGLVRCSCCGSTLIRAKKGKALQCSKYARGGCLESHFVTLDKMNRAVIKQIKEDICEGKIKIERKKKQQNLQGEKTNKILLEQEYSKLQRINLAYQAGIDDLNEYSEKKNDCLHRIEQLKIEEKKEVMQIWKEKQSEILSVENIISMLESKEMKEQEKNNLLKVFVAKVVFFRNKASIQMYYFI